MAQSITNISVEVLKVHPRNTEFFDDISGEEYERFRKSIEEDGLLSPLIVAPDMTVISGHQRLKACREIGYKSVPVIIKEDLDDEDEKLKKLIAANFGRIKNNTVKQARVFQEYARLCGIKRGGDRKSKDAQHTLITLDDMAKELGVSTAYLKEIKRLNDLLPELQDVIADGRISAKTGSQLIAKLSEEDQIALLEKLPAAKKLTQSQVQQYIDQIKGLEHEKQELQKEAVEAVKAAKGAANASDDSADYLQKIKELEEEKEKARLYYEKWNAEKNKERGISPEDAKAETEQEVAKVKADYRRLVDSMQKQLNDYEDAEPEVVTVEVIPEDYEELKAELERLKNSKPDDHIARVLTIDETPEERARYYFTSMQNSTGGFLSEMEGFALQKEFCLPLPADKKAFIAENLRTIVNRCEEIISFIKDCSSNKEVA